MSDDSEYELLPHEEIEHLRNEVEKLKNNPLGKRYGGVDLIDSVHNLTNSINHMNKIFEQTNQEMLQEFESSSIDGQFKSLASQNEQIAKGVVTVVELVQKQTDVLNLITQTMNTINKRINDVEQNTIQLPKNESNDLSNTDSIIDDSPENNQQNTNQKPVQNQMPTLPEPPTQQNQPNLPPDMGNSQNNFPKDIPPLDLPPPKKKGFLGKMF